MTIIFSGIDGAGKSTQIQLLSRWGKNRECTIAHVWVRGGYTPLFSAVKSGVRALRKGALPASGPSVARTRQFSRPWVRRTWLAVAILDLMLVYAVWLRWKRLWNHYVLCDRYIEDTALDFRRNFPMENVETWMLWRLLRVVAPRPDVRFLLLVPVEVSLRRSVEKGEPFPDSAETLAWRLAEYRQMASSSEWHVLDCTLPVGQVHEQIVAAIQG